MGDLVTYTGNSKALITVAKDPEALRQEEERLVKEAEEHGEKLRRIQEEVPTRVYNVCGSSAGAGSGDFHQYRMVRRQEQMRVKRIEEDAQRQNEQEEFQKLQEQRRLEAEAKTSKKRSKRQKKKEKKKSKAGAAPAAGAGNSSNPDAGSDSDSGPEQVALD